ncbi:MAG: DUF4325 domain-containing protein [Planctomycetes bacterium]|nr:DUF4325 domain-containing protein [Planctomycetota bacterium]
MNTISDLILKLASRKDTVRVSDITKTTGFSRAYIGRFFKELQDEGKIALLGSANTARYVLSSPRQLELMKKKILAVHRLLRNHDVSEDIILKDIYKNTGILAGLPENISHIVDYAFLEMLNNAIEHSQSKSIDIVMKRNDSGIHFAITDKGIGIFENIMRKRSLGSHMDAIQDLIKGKQTTSPESHSGQGIFFTSKTADLFIIRNINKKLIFDNSIQDILVKNGSTIKGTKVFFSIRLNSPKELNAIFNEYTDDNYDFSKTSISVKLFKKDVDYLSRSQARRIITGLDKFKTIILDFAGVDTVGQAFADEIFRVWQSFHPNIKITHKNACENVLFMIKRALHAN